VIKFWTTGPEVKDEKDKDNMKIINVLLNIETLG